MPLWTSVITFSVSSLDVSYLLQKQPLFYLIVIMFLLYLRITYTFACRFFSCKNFIALSVLLVYCHICHIICILWENKMMMMMIYPEIVVFKPVLREKLRSCCRSWSWRNWSWSWCFTCTVGRSDLTYKYWNHWLWSQSWSQVFGLALLDAMIILTNTGITSLGLGHDVKFLFLSWSRPLRS